MLTKWFGTRSSCSPQSDRFFRPQLEFLEGRFAPSSIVPMDGPHGHGNGDDNGNGHGNSNNNAGGGAVFSGPVAGTVVNQSGNVHNNIHITNSFNNNTGSFNNVASVAGAGLLSPGQIGSVGALFALSYLIAAETGNTNLGTLMDDEVALAVDNYLLLPGNSSALSASGMSSLKADVSSLNSAIGTLEAGLPFIGPAIGDLTYDFTFNSLVAGQAHI